MQEGDAEDLWMMCLGHAMEMLGCIDGRRPRGFVPTQAIRLTHKLYAECKTETGETMQEERKKAPVIQLKS